MKCIAIYGREFHDRHIPQVQKLFDALLERNIELLFYEPFLGFLRERVQLPEAVDTFVRYQFLHGQADYLFSLGGDGTLLDSTTFVRDSGIPIMGINTGRLGFLTSSTLEEMPASLDALLSGRFTLDRRTLLRVEADSEIFNGENFGLNELTIHKQDTSSMITIHTWVDGHFLNSYWADGLIVSTPTGSTAYSLSCGGPIVMPGSNNFVLTPVAPHNLNVRPVVIPDNCQLQLKVEGRTSNFMASLDSRSQSLPCDLELRVSRHSFTISLLRMPDYSYLKTIRHKLNWGLDKRN